MEYGQFCPIAKAIEILGEKWSLLVVRELLMGSTRFNQLKRGLSQISPTILSRRLDSLCEKGLVLKKKIPGQKGFEISGARDDRGYSGWCSGKTRSPPANQVVRLDGQPLRPGDSCQFRPALPGGPTDPHRQPPGPGFAPIGLIHSPGQPKDGHRGGVAFARQSGVAPTPLKLPQAGPYL